MGYGIVSSLRRSFHEGTNWGINLQFFKILFLVEIDEVEGNEHPREVYLVKLSFNL